MYGADSFCLATYRTPHVMMTTGQFADIEVVVDLNSRE